MDMWFGSREFLVTTVTDDATAPPTVIQSYELALVKFSTPIENAAWSAVATYAGERGIWADGLAVGSYRIFGRVGPGAPNERTIVELGVINVRSR